MTIAVNTHFHYTEKPVGFEQFIIDCVFLLAHIYPEHHFILIVEYPMDTRLATTANIKEVVIRPRLNRQYWYNFLLPITLTRYKTDILVNVGDIFSTTVRIPQCILVHEKAIFPCSQPVPKKLLRFYRKQLLKALQKTCCISTLSEYSKLGIINKFNIEPEKIEVWHPGADAIFAPVDEKIKELTQTKYANGKEYFLYTGPLCPLKDLMNLFKAFSFFKKRQKSNMMLLIAGQQQHDKTFVKKLSTFKYRDEVKLIEPLEPEAFAKLTASAYTIVYPTTSCDFSFRLIEALQCGVPIITSQGGAFSERCGNAALYCDPTSFSDIAEKMMDMFKDENKKKGLGEKGLYKTLPYTRETAAESLWCSIIKCIERVN